MVPTTIGSERVTMTTLIAVATTGHFISEHHVHAHCGDYSLIITATTSITIICTPRGGKWAAIVEGGCIPVCYSRVGVPSAYFTSATCIVNYNIVG